MKICFSFFMTFFLVIAPSFIFSRDSKHNYFLDIRQEYSNKINGKILDSLKEHMEGETPVLIGRDTMFCIHTDEGRLLPEKCIKQIEFNVERLSRTFGIQLDKLYVISNDYVSNVMYDGKLIVALTDKDANYVHMSRNDLVLLSEKYIVRNLKKLQKRYELERIVKNSILVVLIIVLQIILLRLTNSFYQRLQKRVGRIRKKFLKPLFIKNYKFIGVERQVKIIFSFLKFFRLFLILVECFVFLLVLFCMFPQTKILVCRFLLLILSLIKKIGIDIVNYLPDLCTVIIIWLIFRYIVKGIKVIADEIEREHLRLPGFYPEWAKPTFGIFRFLLYAFMLALIYPHLPHSESEAFKGISVLVGLIFSIGSSSAIGNLVAGIIITYMRPFRIGDRIKMGGMIGDVIEKTPIVIRVLTLKNEIITIPNAMVTNAQIVNLSESAKRKGLIVHCEITFGYDTPWRLIHQLLLDGAEATSKVLKDPHPFVLETSFDDFYTTYQINVYIDHADHLLETSSELRQNIRDKFQEAGLSMTSPHFFQKKEDKG